MVGHRLLNKFREGEHRMRISASRQGGDGLANELRQSQEGGRILGPGALYDSILVVETTGI